MSKRLRIWSAIILLAVFGLALRSGLSEPDNPVCQGRRLSAWLTEYAKDVKVVMDDEKPLPQSPAAKAIQEIGTNGLPLILRLTEAKDVPLSWKIKHFLVGSPRDNLKLRSRRLGWCGFQALRASAWPAVPTLTALLTNTNPTAKEAAAVALGYIGPAAEPAIPALIQQLKDKGPDVRSWTIWALGEIHQQSELVVPVLTQTLQNPCAYSPYGTRERSYIIRDSLVALTKFGREAETAVPIMQQLTQDGNWRVREPASNALQKLETVTRASATTQ